MQQTKTKRYAAGSSGNVPRRLLIGREEAGPNVEDQIEHLKQDIKGRVMIELMPLIGSMLTKLSDLATNARMSSPTLAQAIWEGVGQAMAKELAIRNGTMKFEANQ